MGKDLVPCAIQTETNTTNAGHDTMTPEFLIGVLLSGMVATIGFFMKSLVQETKQTRETTLSMHAILKSATESIVRLQETDQEVSRQLINIVERLVRLEERSAIGGRQ